MRNICRHCSSEFTQNKRSNKRYCNESCKDSHMKESRICENCKKSFSVKKYVIRRGQGRLCGTHCRVQNQTGKPRGAYNKIDMKHCKECSKPIEGRSNKLYCSIKCNSAYHGKRRCWKRANDSRNRVRLRKCRICYEYKPDTLEISTGKCLKRICQECRDRPPKKETGIEPKIKMPKYNYDDSDVWEEVERIMNES